MYGLSSGELARIVDGRLVLGDLPPLGGYWEPVMRIVTDSREAGPGDVYWDLGTNGKGDGAGSLPEEAFARGAVGVVASARHIEPWAGAFTVQVRDTRRALRRLGVWARLKLRGRMVLTWGPGSDRIAQLLSAMAGRPAQEPTPTIHNLTDATLQLLRCPPRLRWHVMALDDDCAAELTQISTLCAPHIVAINFAAHLQDSAGVELASQLIEELPVTGLAVVNGDHPLAAQLSTGVARLVYVGTTEECQWRIDSASHSGWRMQLSVNQRDIDVVADPQWSAIEVTTALAVAAELGLSSDECAAGFRRLRAYSEQQDAPAEQTTSMSAVDDAAGDSAHDEVPPSVSGLRESDTTLPPGWKRKAC